MDLRKPVVQMTKRELKRVLSVHGHSSAGSRSVLLDRLQEALPSAYEYIWNDDEKMGTFWDKDGVLIDLSVLDKPITVIDQAPPEKISWENKYPNARVYMCQGTQGDGSLPGERVGARSWTSTGTVDAVVRKDVNIPEGFEGVDLSRHVVVVLGSSGAGKSRLLEKYFPVDKDVSWDKNRAVASQFGSNEEAQRWLLAVGLTSIPSWCKPYHILSTGERYRARMARLLRDAYAEGSPVVLDNFTCQLDRVTARACAGALSKQVRRMGMGCVVASSNVDIVPWVQPDYLVCMDTSECVKVKSVARSGPRVRILVSQTNVVDPLKSSVGRLPLAENILGDRNAEAELEGQFRFNVETEQTNHDDGKVVVTAVELDDSTKMCDSLFDNSFDGECGMFVPDLGSRPELVKPYKSGVICGPSGSSKSVVLRHCFGSPTSVEWDETKTALTHFDLNSKRTMVAVKGVCLGIGELKKPFSCLSAGQQERANLARLLVCGTESPQKLCIDEFTSLLDRSLAIRVARNIASFIREHVPEGTCYIFVTCHTDILDVLDADWICDTQHGYHFHRRLVGRRDLVEQDAEECMLSILRRRKVLLDDNSIPVPALDLVLERCAPWVWTLFRDHHYKTKNLSPNARTFVLRHGSYMVGFVAAIKQVGKPGDKRKREDSWRAHRTVVLPSWQGLGVGSRLSDACGEIHRRSGSVFLAQTVHPRFGKYRDDSIFWEASEWNHTEQEYKIETWKQRLENVRVKLRFPRYIYSHRYIGPQNSEQAGAFKERVDFTV